MQSMSVTRDVSQLSGWLKAVADCRGSQAGHTVRGAGCGPGGGTRRAIAVRAQHARAGEGATTDLGGGGGEQRTENIEAMFVTREVSQPEMSALKLRLLSKRALMSVTPETHQPAMGPYFAVAAVAFETYSVTAVFRLALLVKVWPVQAGGVSDGDGERDGGLGGGGLGEGSGSEGEGGGGGGWRAAFCDAFVTSLFTLLALVPRSPHAACEEYRDQEHHASRRARVRAPAWKMGAHMPLSAGKAQESSLSPQRFTAQE